MSNKEEGVLKAGFRNSKTDTARFSIEMMERNTHPSAF